jgi:hypothetical protein
MKSNDSVQDNKIHNDKNIVNKGKVLLKRKSIVEKKKYCWKANSESLNLSDKWLNR